MQLCGSVSILWDCLSLGLEWKLTFSSPVTTAEFSRFASTLSAAHHHLLGFERAQLEFHHFHSLCLSWCFLRPTWLHIPGCLALGEWSHHHGYLGHENLFCIVLLNYVLSLTNMYIFQHEEPSVKIYPRISLVVQWKWISLPMQGTWVQSLVCEASTCSGATKTVSHDY